MTFFLSSGFSWYIFFLKYSILLHQSAESGFAFPTFWLWLIFAIEFDLGCLCTLNEDIRNMSPGCLKKEDTQFKEEFSSQPAKRFRISSSLGWSLRFMILPTRYFPLCNPPSPPMMYIPVQTACHSTDISAGLLDTIESPNILKIRQLMGRKFSCFSMIWQPFIYSINVNHSSPDFTLDYNF